MRLRQRTRFKFLFIVLAGGIVFSTLLSNCTVFWGQYYQTALNYTWFLTCRTDTLFSGDGLLIDCENVDTTTTDTTGTTTTGGTTGGLDLGGLADLL